MNWCVQCAADKKTIKKATEIHFGRGYCEEHSKGWKMKPNPCKWCGVHPEFEGVNELWFCNNEKCGNNCSTDFDTWQKNNPLPEKKAARQKAAEDMVEEYRTNPELNIDLPPHQFKVGDWVKYKNESRKYQITSISISGSLILDGQGVITKERFSELTPATRLKRKEIRERLEEISDSLLRDVTVKESIAILRSLIEEI